jgi:hypothetical protein
MLMRREKYAGAWDAGMVSGWSSDLTVCNFGKSTQLPGTYDTPQACSAAVTTMYNTQVNETSRPRSNVVTSWTYRTDVHPTVSLRNTCMANYQCCNPTTTSINRNIEGKADNSAAENISGCISSGKSFPQCVSTKCPGKNAIGKCNNCPNTVL